MCNELSRPYGSCMQINLILITLSLVGSNMREDVPRLKRSGVHSVL